MLLFVIGLELKPSRLWALRRDIFGLGVAQVVVCGALLTGVGLARRRCRRRPPSSRAMGLALSSTAIVMQILEERGETTEPHGQKIFSILLLQDLAIVPLLTACRLPRAGRPRRRRSRAGSRSSSPLAAVAGVVAVVRYVLNPMFRIFAAAQARESHDRGGAARRARRRLRHAGRRPVDGNGRLPRRRAPLRIRASAISSRPTSSPSAASSSGSSSSASACRSTCR